ncbi:MAG: hypothetical protein ACYC6L_11215 [Anaerolineae bacterium]
MGVAGKLQTQTEKFWRDEYEVSDADLDLVTSQILEASRPLRIEALSSTIILRRYQRERDAATLHAKSGDVYQPMGSYRAGQRLIFTELDYKSGRVVAVREGHNPKYESFQVIKVQFEDDMPEAEFASEFPYPHPLNRPVEELFGKSDESLSESDIVEAFRNLVSAKLEVALAKNHDFCKFDESWFLRELLPQINDFVLNLAEASIDTTHHHPVAVREILADMNLQLTATLEAQLFALNLALGRDSRFVNVSLDENPVWYLRALMPQAAFSRPDILVPAQWTQGGEYIGSTMLEMVEEIGDELDLLPNQIPQTSDIKLELTFPHFYCGTLPADPRIVNALPATQAKYVPITLVDNRSGAKIDAWLCPDEGYICGLVDWFKKTGLCVGALVSLQLLPDPLTWQISVSPIKGKRSEWICSAGVSDGVLVLRNQRAALEVKADRNMVIDIPDPSGIAALMRESEATNLPLSTIILHVVEELAKQSSKGGSVHAKSVYSAANLIRRYSAVAVFSELTRRACFDPVGGGYWALDPSLQKNIYQTPEDMFERPLSSRGDIVKDRVIQYGRM